jgi:hypothetical protein
MNKNARNRAKDPVQQALRDKKQDWNARARDFISRLISAKSAFNGRPIGKEKTKITDPIDPSVSSALSELASEFNGLASEANEITRAQYEYSVKFQASHSQKTASIEIEAANALTRGLFYLTSPFKKNKHFRTVIVKNTADIKKKMFDLQNFLVSLGSNQAEIHSAWNIVKSKHIAFTKALSEYVKMHPAPVEESDPSTPPAPLPSPDNASTVLSEEGATLLQDLGKAIVRLDDPVELNKYLEIKNKVEKGIKVDEDEIKEFHDRIVQELGNKFASNFRLAHNSFTRSIKKNIKNLIPTDNLGYFKISLYNAITDYILTLEALADLALEDESLAKLYSLNSDLIIKFNLCKDLYIQIAGFSIKPEKIK